MQDIMQELTFFIQNHQFLSIATVLVLLLLIVVEILRAKRQSAAVTAAKATQLINREQAVVIDIRSNEQFRKGHIINALSFSSRELQENNKKIEKYKSRPLIIVCNAGLESPKLATLLQKQGYQTYILANGMRGWINADMPIIEE